MFDPSLIKSTKDTSRTFGHTKIGFAPKVNTRRVIQGDEDIRPNRRDRRAMTARARAVPKPWENMSKAQLKRYRETVASKKDLQRMIKENKRAKRPWYTAYEQYFPEEWVEEQDEETLAKAKRSVKNALKRRRNNLGY